MSGRFFRTDDNDCLGHTVAPWIKAGSVRPMECFSVAFLRFASRHVKQPYAEQARARSRPPRAKGVSRIVFVRADCRSRKNRRCSARTTWYECALHSTSSIRGRQTFSPAGRRLCAEGETLGTHAVSLHIYDFGGSLFWI